MSTLRVLLRDVAGAQFDAAAKIEVLIAGKSRIASEAEGNALDVFSFELDPGSYYVRVDADRHSKVGKLVSFFNGTTVEVRLPMKPSEATIVFPQAPPPNLAAVLGLDLDELDELAHAGLLNVWAKAFATVLPDGRPVAELFKSIFEARQDRIFVELDAAAEVALEFAVEAGLLDHAPASLHDPPREDGYSKDDVISYKSPDDRGNLQVTVFRPAAGRRDLPPLGDVDVDEARGFPHVFDVLEHHVFDELTDPREIYEILRSTGVFPPFGLT